MKVKELNVALFKLGFNVKAMHSDLEQSEREQVMKDFKNGRIDILVATDVVSRGIDINDISLVVNFDIPNDPEDYVHRIGRTARGTNGEGVAITFVGIEEQAKFQEIEHFLNKEVYKIPIDPAFGDTPAYDPKTNRGFKKRRTNFKKNDGNQANKKRRTFHKKNDNNRRNHPKKES